MATNKEKILELSIKALTIEFDRFIEACMFEGYPKAPTKRDLNIARGCLPSWCKTSLVKKRK